jgi:TusA-related sulfurtransferase
VTTRTVDARGLSCPEPVLLAKRALEEAGSGSVEVLLDAEASLFNVRRMAENRGWSADYTADGPEFRLVLRKE